MEEGAPEMTPREASSDEKIIEGTGAAPGIAIGPVYRYVPTAPEVRQGPVAPDQVDVEVDRLANAVQRAEQELETARALAPAPLTDDSSAIFEAQALMLRDEEVLRAIRARIRDERMPAGAAVQDVLAAHRQRLGESDDAHLRTGTDDLRALERRLLRALQHSALATTVDARSVVAAPNLTATDLLRFHRYDLLGAVTAQGGPASHTAIVAKALGLPLLVGAGDLTGAVSSGDRVILDGTDGRLIVHPRPATVEEYRDRQAEDPSPATAEKGRAGRPLRTTDGRTVTLRANIGIEPELELLDAHGADGIGLLRTELYLRADDPHSIAEEQQAQAYRKAAEAAGEAGATIRLLDLGGDEWGSRPPSETREAHPSLGWRGLRVLLDRPDDWLRPQLRALLRANHHGALRILLPMVTDVAEVRRVRDLLDEERDRLATQNVPHDPALPLGVMVEVPAVALRASAFAEHVDFFSVGTNDLTQYVLAVDRRNERVGTRHDALHPAVLGLLLRVVEAGRMARCPVEVCGEIAADVQAVPVLLGLGVDALSVAPPSLPAVRRVVRATEYQAAKDLAREVLQADDARAVRRRAREWVDAHLGRSAGISSEDSASDSGASDG